MRRALWRSVSPSPISSASRPFVDKLPHLLSTIDAKSSGESRDAPPSDTGRLLAIRAHGEGTRESCTSSFVRNPGRLPAGPASRLRLDNASFCSEVAQLIQSVAVRLDPCRQAPFGVTRRVGGMTKTTHFSVDFLLQDNEKSSFPQVVKKLAVANPQKSGSFLSLTLNRSQTETQVLSRTKNWEEALGFFPEKTSWGCRMPKDHAFLRAPAMGAAAFRLAQDIDHHGARRCQAKLRGARCGNGCGVA